ncbi:hypothetical protein HK102_000013 [Quaeritorhiza haematococci]|nr:hypothetical protein HK102_000013 [Quaeritorhiza haematococci]
MTAAVDNINLQKVGSLIKRSVPKLDSDVYEYIIGYFSDVSNDRSTEALLDFLQPLFSESGTLNDDEIEDLCSKLSDMTANGTSQASHGTKLIALDTPMQMKNAVSATLEFTSVKVKDLSHTVSRNAGKSAVDKAKLRDAEARLQKKREKRGDNNLYDGIPVWNPDVKPAIVVNQGKLAGSGSGGNGDGSGGGRGSKDIKLENFDISYAGKKILTNADLQLNFGRRYGLVGKNGVGKSTLFRAIAHKELRVPSHIRILHVEQEIAGDDTEALQSVLQADVEREGLLKEEKDINAALQNASISSEESTNLSSRLKAVYQKLEEIESDKAESRASMILSGLGFSPEQQRAATKTFSGGWRMRLALARALFCRPDLLLADEVTNYLDFPAVVWLERYFQNWPSTLFVVSHDRSFLDAVSTDIYHLHNGQLDSYRGNFSTFVGTRAERRRNQIREYEAQLQYRQHLQAFIDRWRYNAKRAAQAQSKIKILEKLPPLEAPPKDEMEGLGEGESTNVYFKFPDPERLSPPILQMDDVTFGYDKSRLILKGISFDLQMDSKIAIVGPNGAGKSTMVRLLLDQLQPNSGQCQRHGRLRIAEFSQHHVDQLELGASSVQFLQSKFPGKPEEEYRRILGRFGLTGMTALQPIGTLSGGQKSRVVFAWMALSNPHVLILDEPTNHLDMDSIDALANALRTFKGGVGIVSHDERFLDAVCSEVWVCDGGKLTRFEGRVGDGDGVVKQYKKSLKIEEV